MQLSFSVATRSRAFAKAMRRVRSKLQPLLDAFEATALEHPIHQAILVGITDEKGQDFFEEVKNDEGFFQVIVGCCERVTEKQLAEDVFEILLRAVRLCPFSRPDHEKFEHLFDRLRPVVLATES